MKNKLVRISTTEGDDENIVWKIDKGDGAIVINVTKLFDGDCADCHWIDNNCQFLYVAHSHGDGSELCAIVNTNGVIIRDNIKSIEEYVEGEDLFIIQIANNGLNSDDWDYEMIDCDFTKWAVLNRYGKFVIPPQDEKIWYEPSEKIFSDKHEEVLTKCDKV